MNNPETFVLTQNRFNTYIILFFSDERDARNYKMPNRFRKHRDLEELVNAKFSEMFKTDENSCFLIGTERSTYVYIGNNVFSSNTIVGIVK